MPLPKPLTKEQILLAMHNTLSNRAAARFLNVSYGHYKKWAKLYHEFEGGRDLFEIHLNQRGLGIPKHLAGNSKKQSNWNVLDVVEGRISHTHFKPEEIKRKMIEEGILKEECGLCGFHERRVSDYKIPIILNFRDNNPNHYNLGNIRFLCYNCYFLNQGDIFNKKDIIQLETHQPTNGTSDAIDFELDDFQKEQLTKLGLYQPPKDDGSEFISRM
jgi:5-methylcytosine-specific restriction endonuclease McrA